METLQYDLFGSGHLTTACSSLFLAFLEFAVPFAVPRPSEISGNDLPDASRPQLPHRARHHSEKEREMSALLEQTPPPTTRASQAAQNVGFSYVHSSSFPELLRALRCSLAVTTYQAGKLAVFREQEGRLSMLPRTFDRAMGLAVSGDRMAIGARYQIWELRNSSATADQMKPVGRYDACYLPQTSHITGDIDGHEMAWGQEGLWVVNTLFSCLCGVVTFLRTVDSLILGSRKEPENGEGEHVARRKADASSVHERVSGRSRSDDA